MAICGQCGKTVKDDAKFCGGCGATRTVPASTVEATTDMGAAPTAALVCPTCGKPLAKPGATFCGSCGAKIEAAAAPAASPQTPPEPPQAAPPPPALRAAPPAKPAPSVAPPPPISPAPKAAVPPSAFPPVPGGKKKGSPVLMILVIVALVGFVFLAAAGVGGYLFWKKAKAKAASTLAEVTQQAEQQAQEAQAQTQTTETTEETPPEPTPSPVEADPSQQMAQTTAPEPSEAPPSRHKTAPPVAQGTVKPVNPTQDIEPDQVNLDNLDKPLLVPAETVPAPPVTQPAVLGLILESEAPGIKMVVKVDGAKVFEQDMVATSGKQRISKELPVTAGSHHIRVAVWRPPQPPVAGEWDFTFEPGSHPVFRLDLKSNWKMEVKRFQ